MTRREKQRAWYPPWGSWLIYVVLSVLMTWPLARHLSTRFGGNNYDIFNVYWGSWWIRKALSTGQSLYVTKYLLYPIGFDLTTFAFSPLYAFLWIPLTWIVPPIAAYNLLVWVTIVLCCVAMDQLVRYLTGNPWAALVAGVAFGFAPILAAERSAHLNLAMIAWIPWATLFLTRLMRDARIRDAIALAVAVGLSFVTRLHVGVLVVAFCGVYFVGLALVEYRQWHRLAIRRLLLSALLATVLLSPLLVHVWQVLRQPGVEDLLREASDMQGDLLSYVVPTPQHPLFGSWTKGIYEQRLPKNVDFYWTFVGYLPLALLIYTAVSRPKEAFPWLLAGLFFWILGLGTCLRINGQLYEEIRLPYGLAESVFSALGFDRPNRFNLGMVPPLAALTGLACARIAARIGKSWPLGVLAGAVLFEFAIVPMPLIKPPSHSPFYDQMAADGEEYAIVDLPLTREASKFHRYYQTIHEKPLVGGWSHRVLSDTFTFIDGDPLLRAWRGKDEPVYALPSALDRLAQANVRYIVLHKDQLMALPEGMRGLLLTLEPVYEDDSIYVLPTEATSDREYAIAHRFDKDLALIEPAIFLTRSGAVPTLNLDTCWLWGGKQDVADGCRVTLFRPDGSIIEEQRAAFPPLTTNPVCQDWPLTLSPPFLAGSYQVRITPLSGERALGTFTTTVPIHVVQDKAGVPFPLLGYDFSVTFDAPIEMLGYDVATGDNVLWLDLHWRALADHNRAYVLFVQLLDPATKEQAVPTIDDLIHKLEWKEGEIVHERRVLMIHDIPQGQYDLGIGLYPAGEPYQRIDAFDKRSGRKWPGDQAILDRPVLGLPLALQGSPVSEEGRIVIYTEKGAPAEPAYPIQARFGDVARLTGYRLEPEEVIAGQELRVMLYWEAINAEPVDVGYKVFVHLVDESGTVMVAQHDGEPVDGQRSTRTWKNGDKVIDTHEMNWQVPAYTGTATIMVGLYDFQTLERLPAYGAENERWPDDRISLGQIEVSGAAQ